jgi:Uma2 family endonuclease
MAQTAISIGPQDHGRRMSLDDFDHAEGQEGYIYELSGGVVTVIDIPNPTHLAQINAVRRQLAGYDLAHPGRIHRIAAGSECKILVASTDSERHPDVAIYKTAPLEGRDLWVRWIPEIVIEVVSPGSSHRDYVEKREDYLAFGVLEYWIFDAERVEMLALKRSKGAWVERAVRAAESYRTRLLPGFVLELAAVFP